MKMCVFGGTFDPIHVGHLMIAEDVRGSLGLDQVLFVPTGQPWLKEHQPVSAAHHRLAMVSIATTDNPCFHVSSIEAMRPGPSYCIDTLIELHRTLGPEVDLYFLLGLDALAELDRWHQPNRVLELCTLVAVARPGSTELDRSVLESVRPGASTEVLVVEAPLISISSTEIRERVLRKLSIKYRVPEQVEVYIHEHGLYKSRAEQQGR